MRHIDEFANQRTTHPLERRGFDCVRRCAGVHFAGDIRPEGESRSMAMPCSRISVHLPTPDGHLDSLRPELRPVAQCIDLGRVAQTYRRLTEPRALTEL
ncbi:Hypothetical protein CINCED_3A013148 [Cinara cedri]|uniref:Uncharacterized protein n=1 Tax=Cinara cedri TaxID=506608 RepID=A0A5E4MU33_9HEMI|nr:Hypothetical protein CINCED_3A013148 [Cinara cedri]